MFCASLALVCDHDIQGLHFLCLFLKYLLFNKLQFDPLIELIILLRCLFLKHADVAAISQPAKHQLFYSLMLLLVLVEIARDNLSLKANVLSFFKIYRVKLFAVALGLFPQLLENLLISETIGLSVNFHFLLYSFQIKKSGLVLNKISIIQIHPRCLSKYRILKFLKIETRNMCSSKHLQAKSRLDVSETGFYTDRHVSRRPLLHRHACVG